MPKCGRPGFGLLEIIIVLAVVGVALLSLFQMVQFSLRLQNWSSDRAAAAVYLREGAEALRFVRDAGWQRNIATLATGPVHYIAFANGAYSSTSTAPAPLFGRYYREFTLANVTRDANDEIAASGVMDTSTKRVSLRVSWWNGSATATEAVDFYLADIFGN